MLFGRAAGALLLWTGALLLGRTAATLLVGCTAGVGAAGAGPNRPGRIPPRGLLLTGAAFWAAGAEV